MGEHRKEWQNKRLLARDSEDNGDMNIEKDSHTQKLFLK